MKKIILLILSLFLIFRLSSQDIEIEAFDPTGVYEWLDKSYEDFFSQPVINNKNENNTGILPKQNYDKSGEYFVILPTHDYNQFREDPPNNWHDKIMGEKNNCSNKISATGCAITSQAMIIKSRGYNIDPGTWDNYLKDIGSYYGCLLKFQDEAMYNYTFGDLYHISKQYPLPYRGTSDDNMAALVLKYWIDRGAYIIIKVTRIGRADGTVRTTSSHFMLVKGYYTRNPSLKDFIVADPGTSYDNGKNVKLEHYYYDNGKSPLFISSTGYPTFRIYANIATYAINPPEMPTFTPYLSTGDYFNISIPNQKATSGFDISWILRRNGVTKETQNGDSFSYYLTKPGNYTITLVVGGEHGITETTKSFTVTGDPIILPEDCYGYLHTIPSELSVSYTTIYFKYDVPGDCYHNCSWNCSSPAFKATGPSYLNYSHGCVYNYAKLQPNAHYKFWTSYSDGWSCNEFWSCKYNYDRFFTDCYANIITTPNDFSRNSKLIQTGQITDKAFNNVVLKPGFSYKPQNHSDSYSANISSGKQFWITCVDCYDKKSDKPLPLINTVVDDCEIGDLEKDTTVFFASETEEPELKIKLYPNPSHGTFNVEVNQNIDFEINVYNMTGRILSLRNIQEINLSNYPSGLYIVKFKAGDLEIDKKIMKID